MISVTVNGQNGPNVTATTGDQVGVVVGAAGTYNLTVSPAGTPGGQGATGPSGPPSTTISVGNVSTLAPGANATVTSSSSNGGANITLSFGIPAGATGATGSPGTNGTTPTLTIGTVTTGAAGSSAAATITQTGANATLNLTIPRGDPGSGGGGSSNLTLSDATPSALGTASAGTSSLASRADHTHALPTIAYANLSGVPSNFPTNIASVSGLQAALDGKQAAGNYVTGVNNLTGSLTLVAGSGVTITPGSGNLTIAATGGGGLGANDAVDGGDYVGVAVAPGSITVVAQPQNATSTTSGASESWSYSLTSLVGGYIGPAAGNNGKWVLFGQFPRWWNGSQWNAGTVDASGYYTLTAAYGDGKYVGLGFFQNLPYINYIITSTDGESFQTLTNATFPWVGGTPAKLLRSGSLWVLGVSRFDDGSFNYSTLYSTQSILTSPDLTTWTARTLPSACAIKCMAQGNGRIVAIGTAANGQAVAFYSDDSGLTWYAGTIPQVTGGPSSSWYHSWLSVAFANNRFVAVGAFWSSPVPGSESSNVAISTDGATWTIQESLPTDTPRSWAAITAASGRFIAASVRSTAYATSGDGLAWTARSLSNARPSFGLASDGTNAISVHPDPSLISVSISSPVKSAAFSVTAVAGSQVSYQWQTSSDAGSTWSSISGATTSTLSLTGLTSADSGKQYRCQLSATGASTVYTRAATLTVN